MKIISWNVNGIRSCEKKGFIDILQNLNPDVMLLQETKANEEQLSDELKNINFYESYFFSSTIKKGYSGVAAYTKLKPLNIIYGLESEEHDVEGRTITLEYKDFYIINNYFPNSQHELKRIDFKISYNNKLLDFANNLKTKKNVIICGDFNVAHKAIDLSNPKRNEMNPGYSIQERTWMDKFIDNDFVDTFRIFNKEPDNYTWWSYRFKAREKNIGWRIDYFCVNKKMQKQIKSSIILNDIYGSDHCPIQIEIN